MGLAQFEACPMSNGVVSHPFSVEKAIVRLAWSVWLLVFSLSVQAGPPNIIILLADDLGWNDVGYHNENVQTPSIDSIAASGIELNRFYVEPTCSPTRASLLTGLFSVSHGIDVPIVQEDSALPLHYQILPQHFQAAGYRTVMVGKWHLGGAQRDQFPHYRGFDSFYGHLHGAIGYYDHVYGGGVDWQRNGETIYEEGYATDLIADEAIRQINSTTPLQPLLLYVAFNAPHTPLEAPVESVDPTKADGRATLIEMIEALDHAIGRILESLESQGLLNDSIVFFGSDNGGQNEQPLWLRLLVPAARDGYGNNQPLRDGKGSVFEGGIRVPAAIWWPQRLESDDPSEQVMHIADLLPTLAEAAGIDLEQSEFDGVSMLGPLSNGTVMARPPIVVSNLGSDALIEWPWKLVRDASLPFIPDWLKSEDYYLFHLQDDEFESRDLSEQFPERFIRMRNSLLSMDRRSAIDFKPGGHSFGGEVTREPWAESAQ